MILRQTLSKPINGYWDGGAKATFDWSIDPPNPFKHPVAGFANPRPHTVRIGSWAANHFFTVACGQSEKATLGNARRALSHQMRYHGMSGTFEYLP